MSLQDLIPFRKRSSNVPVHTRNRNVDPFLRLHEEMNRMFEDFLPDFFGRNPSSLVTHDGWSFSPDIQVKETRKEITVKAEIPGIDEKDLDVRLENNMLTIRGEKKEENHEEEGDCMFSECRYGSFQRSIPLGAEVDSNRIEATFKKGVLKIRLPKIKEEETRGHRIEVKTA